MLVEPSDASYARRNLEDAMTGTATLLGLACSQCGCDAPDDPAALASWVYGRLALSGELDEVIDRLLLCPGCIEDEHLLVFEEGGED